MNDKSLRETAERIIEGIPKSYRDGDESAGRERTVTWLIGELEKVHARGWMGGTDNQILLREIDAKRGEADTKRLVELLRIARSGLDEYWTLNNPDEVKAIDAAR